ncbi:MAG: hypothetical protein EOM13_06380, partial [Clostridia bacterium]|nr:hypothetical protein [Clostridia bacterium]
EIFVFFMLLPYMQKPEEFGKALKGGLTIGAVVLLLITLRDIVILGNYTLVSTLPSFSVLRLINLAEIFTRLEILYAILLIVLLFFKVSILYFASVTAVSRLMKFSSYHFLVPVFGGLIVIYAISVFESSFEHMYWKNVAAPIYSTFFELVLPVVTLIVAAVRKVSAKEEAKPS